MEGSGRDADREIIKAAQALKRDGMPFDLVTSSQYQPLASADFRDLILGEPNRVTKANPLAQIADLVLYPIARAKYQPNDRSYRALKDAGRLLDDVIDPNMRHQLGIKFSCFS